MRFWIIFNRRPIDVAAMAHAVLCIDPMVSVTLVRVIFGSLPVSLVGVDLMAYYDEMCSHCADLPATCDTVACIEISSPLGIKMLFDWSANHCCEFWYSFRLKWPLEKLYSNRN